MKVNALIQARMSSKRFPGKVLFEIAGKPVIEYLLDSLRNAFDDTQIVIATSLHSSDDPLVEYCQKNKLQCYRGSLESVAQRFAGALEAFPCQYFARICGDSPLFDYRIVQKAIDQLDPQTDIVSTAVGDRYPSGMNFEVLRSSTFLDAVSKFNAESHHEHCTSYFYEHSDQFVIKAVPKDPNIDSSQKYSFDTEQDLVRIKAMIESFTKPHYEYPLSELCEIYTQV